MIKVKQKDTDGKPTRFYSTRQEKHVAKVVGGTRTKNSGATMWDKGDVKTDSWLIECKTKTSSSESISIKKDWIRKNLEEALFTGKKNNAICFSFGLDEPNYYIIDEDTFQWLVENFK